jgi:uncharacterized protein DUF4397
MCVPLDALRSNPISMRLRRLWPLGLLLLALASTGCGSGRKNPPDTTVRAINVVPSFQSLAFRREQLTASNLSVLLGYQAGTSPDETYDEDTYTFYVASATIGTGQSVDRDSFSYKVVAGTLYTFVFMESGGAVTHTVLESPRLTSSATNAQVQAAHGVETLPTVDVYLEAPGTDISSATPWGTIGFKESLASREVPAGTYELVVTEAGNPAHVLFTTESFELGGGVSNTFVLSPDAGEGIAPLNVLLFNGTGSTPLVDDSYPAYMRALNGATDQAPRDVAVNNQFTPPLFPAAPFAMPTSYQTLAAGASIPINVTPVGNPGVLELTNAVSVAPAKAYTTFFTGDAGALALNFEQDNRRRIAGQATITFYDAAPVGPDVDVLILVPGTDPNTVNGFTTTTSVTPGSVQPASMAAPASYEIWLRTFSGTVTPGAILAGPVSVTLADKGLYGIVLSNDANGTSIDMTLIDDFL